MEKVEIYKCDFCKRTSFYKASIKAHERKCFYNPDTHSCATCLWLNTNHVRGPMACLVGESFEAVRGIKPILRTRCNKWINVAVVEDIEVSLNEYDVLSQIMSGNPKTLDTISRIKAEGTSYYGGE